MSVWDRDQWLTTRVLRVTLIGPTQVREDERLSAEGIAVCWSAPSQSHTDHDVYGR